MRSCSVLALVLFNAISLSSSVNEDRHLAASKIPPAGASSIISSLRQLGELTASDPVAGDLLGSSVAISGNTVVVGSPLATVGANRSMGAAYVFVKPTDGWSDMTQTAKLEPSDGGSGGFFGSSVTIDGDTIVVSALHFAGQFGPGSAYVFVKRQSDWVQVAELTASDGIEEDGFGFSVSVSSNTVLVGAQTATINGVQRGAAYVFVRPSTGWSNMSETAKLTASDGMSNDFFGHSVSVRNDVAVIGAPSSNPSAPGTAYVFVMPPTGWASMTQTAKLAASDGKAHYGFGISVAIDLRTVVVGAIPSWNGMFLPGRVYVFLEPASGWTNMTENAKLTTSDSTTGDLFGYAVSISGDVVMVGARTATINGNLGQGAAYLYVKPSAGWSTTSRFQAKFVASDGASDDQLGSSVSLSGHTSVAGAPLFNSRRGAAYVFGP